MIGLVRLTGGVGADHVIIGQVDGIISVSILIDKYTFNRCWVVPVFIEFLIVILDNSHLEAGRSIWTVINHLLCH